MISLQFDNNKSFFFFYYDIWNRKQKIKVMSDSECCVKEVLSTIVANIQLIDRNKERIARIIYNDRYTDMNCYADDLIDSIKTVNFEHFLSGLYISKIRIELYKDGEFDVIFSVMSKHKHRLDFDYDECILYFDHSFEI